MIDREPNPFNVVNLIYAAIHARGRELGMGLADHSGPERDRHISQCVREYRDVIHHDKPREWGFLSTDQCVNAYRCGIEDGIREVEALINRTTGKGATCPKCGSGNLSVGRWRGHAVVHLACMGEFGCGWHEYYPWPAPDCQESESGPHAGTVMASST